MKIFGTVAMTVYMLMIAASDPAEAEPPRHDRDSAQIGALQSYTTGKEDTLLEIARRFDLGFVELLAANPGIDPWVPGAGIKITLPTAHLLPLAPRRGIVLNLAEQRLYFFPPDGGKILTFPVGTGMAGYEMPLTTTRVSGKRINPTWVPPASIRAERPELPASIPPGPDNPLGAYAID
ncbi:MAG: L,D-transpeptidase family protein, partial [Rhodospirillales bacterium]|nr:L,D-transpeptidase family protein [Rhodospirillales bacterium]